MVLPRHKGVHIEDERLYLLLDRYLAGEASARDAEIVREWLSEDAAHAQILADLRLIKHIANDTPPPTSVDAAWMQAVKTLGVGRKPRVVRRLLMVALAAAAVVVAVVGGWAVLGRVPAWREVSTAVGHRTVVHLRDGTQITLAPKSRLRYTADYGKAHRDVYLDGEAYFQVSLDTPRPFRVHTERSITEDLGTAFVVRAYSEQNATEVVVAEGRVALWRADTARTPVTHDARPNAQPGLVLEARDLGRLDANGGVTLRRGIDVARQLAWTSGVLAFDGAPLRDVVRTLGRWYNAEIRLPDGDSALGARRLTATFTNEPIDLVLQRIALTLGLRVERAEGSVFVLRPGLRARARH